MNAQRLLLQASLVLTCYLAAAVRTDALHGRQLLQARAESGSTSRSEGGGTAVASSSATSTGGVAKSFASADSSVVEEAKSVIIQLVAKAVSDVKNGDAVAIAVATGKAIGTAVAEAHAQTVAIVFVEGDGEACATAEADAVASATTFAVIVADAIVRATRGDPDSDPKLRAEADASAKAIAVGTADATAEAFSSACSKNGFGKAQQDSFAQATAVVYAEATAKGLAFVIGSDAQAVSKSVANAFVDGDDVTATASGSTKVTGDTNAAATGTGGASASQVKECKGRQVVCCTPFFASDDTCDCGARCRMVKQSSTPVITWRPRGNTDARGDCFCPPDFFG